MAANFGQLIQVAGGLLQGIGQYQQVEARSAQADAQAAAFEANARIAEMNAAAAIQSGEAAKERRERVGKARLASKATGYLKSGVVLSGSPLAVLGDEALNEALAAEDELFEAKLKATQYRNQAQLQRFYSEGARNKASRIESQGGFRVGTTLLGSAIRTFR